MPTRTITRSVAAGCLLTAYLAANAQNNFEITIPIPGLTNVAGGAQDPEGGFVFGGEVGDGLIVLRTDSTGAVQWTRQLAESANDEGIYDRSLAVSGDRIFMGGYAMGPNTLTRDGLLHVLALDGTVLYQRLIDVAGSSNAIHSITATAHGALIAGRSIGAGSYDMLLQQVDENGTVQGSWSYGSNGWDWAYDVITCTSGGMALFGYGDEVGGPAPSAYLVRTDDQGQEVWARGIDGASADEGYCVMEDATTDDLYVGGLSLGMGSVGTHGFISKFSPDGTHQWTRVIGNAFDVIGITAIAPGQYAALMRAQNIAGGHGDYDPLLIYFNADGELQGNRLFGTTASEYPVGLSRTANGGLLITSLLTGGNGNGVYAVLTDPAGVGGCTGTSVELTWSDYTPTIYEHISTLQNGSSGSDWAAVPTQPAITREFVCCTYPVVAAFTADQIEGPQWAFTNQSQGQGIASWAIDGTTLVGDTVSYTFPAPGLYNVCITVEGICMSDVLCQDVEVVGTGIGEGPAPSARFSPNPATDRVLITGLNGVRAIDVLDPQGRLLRSWPVNGAQVLQLDVSGLPDGLLVVRCVGATALRTQRLVKYRDVP